MSCGDGAAWCWVRDAVAQCDGERFGSSSVAWFGEVTGRPITQVHWVRVDGIDRYRTLRSMHGPNQVDAPDSANRAQNAGRYDFAIEHLWAWSDIPGFDQCCDGSQVAKQRQEDCLLDIGIERYR
ncbi:hypothetical protein D9M71_652870 [compost metagenome]